MLNWTNFETIYESSPIVLGIASCIFQFPLAQKDLSENYISFTNFVQRQPWASEIGTVFPNP